MDWRKRLDPLKLFMALGLLLFGGLIWWFSTHAPPSDDLIPLPPPRADAVPGPPPSTVDAGPQAEDADPIRTRSPRTRRGKLVQRELEKKRLAQKGDPAIEGRDSSATNVVLAGADSASQRAFARKLKGVSVSSTMTRGYLVTLKVQSGGSSESAWVKCSATISELPQKKLASALSSRADVAGEGTDRDELVRDASEACMSSLGQDVSAWIRAHR